MTALTVISAALHLVDETDPAKVEAVLEQLADEPTKDALRRAWVRHRAASVQRIGARCHCGRPIPTSSACGCCCANHESEIPA